MAYVRRRGNQLAIVHGERDDQGKVGQRLLVTLYSKAEALRILDDNPPEGGGFPYFRTLIEHQYPSLRFNWEQIKKGVAENMEILPDLHPYRQTHANDGFRAALTAFTRELLLANPEDLAAASAVLTAHHDEMQFVSDLLAKRLTAKEVKFNEFNRDNPFYWRYTLRGSDAPEEGEAMADSLYKRGDLEGAAALFRLLVEAFPDYADGHNSLGLIALDRDKLDEALEHFERTMVAGRRKFPRRMNRKYYWSDYNTRPYMRGMHNVIFTLIRLERYSEALAWCDRLESECADRDFAHWQRSMIHLNEGNWDKALASANLADHAPLCAAIAAFEAKRTPEETLTAFVNAIVQVPNTVRKVFNKAVPEPTNLEAAEDWNSGVADIRGLKGYLSRRKNPSRRYFTDLLEHPILVSLLGEIDASRRAFNKPDLGDDERRRLFDRQIEIKTMKFIRKTATDLAASYGISCPQSPLYH